MKSKESKSIMIKIGEFEFSFLPMGNKKLRLISLSCASKRFGVCYAPPSIYRRAVRKAYAIYNSKKF